MTARVSVQPRKPSQTQPPARPAMRRGACPALSAPMQTGDGLLIRLSPVSGGLSPRMLIGLCESAARHGNGVVEVTARGSLQFRGFSAASAGHFAGDVDALGIAVRTGVPVETSPLAGVDPTEIADPTQIAEAVRERVARAGLAERLGPKVSVVVDGGGSISMKSVAADVRLVAELQAGGAGNEAGQIIWEVALAGDARAATSLGAYDATTAVDMALSILKSIAALGPEARGRDIISAAPPARLVAKTSRTAASVPAEHAAPRCSTPTLSETSAAFSPSPSRIRSTPLPPPEGEDGRRAWDQISSVTEENLSALATEPDLGEILPPLSSTPIVRQVENGLMGRADARRPSCPPSGALRPVPKALVAPAALPKVEKAGSLPEAAGTRRSVEDKARDGEGEGFFENGAASDDERPLGSSAKATDTNPFAALATKTSRLALPFALSFGYADAATLIDLARQAEALGVVDIRPAPDRRLLLICPSGPVADATKMIANDLGFISRPADIRSNIAACPGAPLCASGHIPARLLAGEIAAALDDSGIACLSIHISGCEKGCARQAASAVTIIGGENGAALVVHGTTRSQPVAYRNEAGLAGAIAAVATQLNRMHGGDGHTGRGLSAADKNAEPGETLLAKMFSQG